MRTLTGKPLFAVEDVEYRWGDVFVAAGLRKEWPGLRRPTDAGLAVERDGDDGDQTLDDDADAAAEEFRHLRGLLAAEDLERWLEERDLSVDAWLGHLRRVVLLGRAGGGGRTIPRAAPNDVREPLRADLICSGELDRLGRDLAGRAAGAAAAGEGKARPARAPSRLPADLVAVLAVSPEEVAERSALLARLEERFARFVAATTSAARIAHAIEMNRASWTRLRLRTTTVDDIEKARELALLVRVDGFTLSEAARSAGVALVEDRFFSGDLPLAIHDRVAGARRGDLVGPFETPDGFVVSELVQRTEPSSRDKAVRKRAADAALRSALDREISDRVRWIDRSLQAVRV